MAIGTTAAILGSAAIGAGASALGSAQQSRAINRAQQAQDATAAQNLALQERMFNTQRADFEPFRQYGIQQANALGEIFGFNPVGGQQASMSQPMGQGQSGGMSAGQAYFDANPDVAQYYQSNPNALAMFDGDIDAAAQHHFNQFGRNEGRQYDQHQNALASPSMSNQPVGSPEPVSATGQDASRDRFEGSLFNNALQGQLGRAATGVDAAMAAQGNVFSGAREQAQANTAADLGMNALGMYTSTLMGSPSSAGAAGSAAAAGQYGANAGNILAQQGASQAQSAYNRGANQNALLGNLANAGGFALGAMRQFGNPAAPNAFSIPSRHGLSNTGAVPPFMG